MDAVGQRVARSVRREREAAGLSVSELARRAGLAKATVSQLESGGNPSVETLWAIATALGVPFPAFVDPPREGATPIRASAATGIRPADPPSVAALRSPPPPPAPNAPA